MLETCTFRENAPWLLAHRDSRVGTDTGAGDDDNLPGFPQRIRYVLKVVGRSRLDV